MQALRLQIAGVILALIVGSSVATERNQSARRQFQRANPCPANQERRGPCPGYVVDHIIPLCAAGADEQSNMQWQPLAESFVKDADERRQCARLRRLEPDAAAR